MLKKVVFVSVLAFLATLTLSAQTINDAPAWQNPEWALVIVGIITAFVIGYQSLATARAAKATEASVEAGRDTAKRQLRAYLSVVIGGAVYQETGKNVRFEGKPTLINTGQTPAHKIRFVARAAILPIPLPKETHLPVTGAEGMGETVLGQHQTATMGSVVEGFCHDNEVESIKQMSTGKALFVWGLVTYEDVFGDKHQTQFCQQLYWLGTTVQGFYTPGRNQSD